MARSSTAQSLIQLPIFGLAVAPLPFPAHFASVDA